MRNGITLIVSAVMAVLASARSGGQERRVAEQQSNFHFFSSYFRHSNQAKE